MTDKNMTKKILPAAIDVKRFAEKHFHYVDERKWNDLERAMLIFTNYDYSLFDNIYQRLLEEGIKRGQMQHLNLLMDKMLSIQVLNCLPDSEVKSAFGSAIELPKSPFVTDDPDLMRMILKHNCDKGAKCVVWRNDNCVKKVEGTPLALAFEYGNKELLEIFVGQRLLEG